MTSWVSATGAARPLLHDCLPQLNDLSSSLVALDQDSRIIAVVELSQSSWLVAGALPGIEVNRARSWSREGSGLLRWPVRPFLAASGE